MLLLKTGICFLTALSSVVLAKKTHLPDFGDQCGRNPPLSCTIAVNSTSSCCAEQKAGLFLLSQFWDIRAGYKDKFTIHGLWNDFCDGTYPAYCDKSREFTNITDILIENHQYQLLQDLNNVWPNSQGVVDEFWAHEWNKHGTCMNTLEPTCYKEETKTDLAATHQGMIDYFQISMDLYKKYDLYKALKRHGMKPGRTYETARAQKAIQKEFGMFPDLRCDKKNNLVEIWTYFHVNGPIGRKDLVPQPFNQNVTNCKETFIYRTKYPKNDDGSDIW
ncbi:unnamed protein product [Cunninghamella echinulata]